MGELILAAARARIIEISERHNLHVDPDALVEDLPVGVRQRVEILKALLAGADLLILAGNVALESMGLRTLGYTVLYLSLIVLIPIGAMILIALLLDYWRRQRATQ